MHHECRCLMRRYPLSRYRGMASSLSTTTPPLNHSPNQPPVPVAPLSSLPMAPSRGYLLRASYLLLTGGRSTLFRCGSPAGLLLPNGGRSLLLPVRGPGAVSSSSRQPPPGAEARRSVLPSSSRRGARRGVLLLQDGASLRPLSIAFASSASSFAGLL
ncbi:hypothetical protein SETIT_2G373700v2 [Setaria italica]|uniref:Uncharacterized protein n=1 Tax=Setaria italica TaxID=4555 RepID=A0A368Q7K2_SETIT|nr:hypothetical protein SETIT_2G373700v2 [Setaria italica]